MMVEDLGGRPVGTNGRPFHTHRSRTGGATMLVLSRTINERILIGDSIVLTVVQVRGGAVRIGIDAPREVAIAREELLHGRDGPDAGRPDALAH